MVSVRTLRDHLMRPPGQGIASFSVAMGDALTLQRTIYQHCFDEVLPSVTDFAPYWQQTWEHLAEAKTVIIGVPSDTGAGIRRGAAYGPLGIRHALLRKTEYLDWLRGGQLIDLGDIYINPHLLHDEMLSGSQRRACQDAMYAEADELVRRQFAVSALSQLEQIIEALQSAYPDLRILLLGGDHSIAWPMAKNLSARYKDTLAIVQPDAHTDLLAHRLGVKYCFGTWSYHANECLHRSQRLVQVGVRQSLRPKEHWETLGVKQYWAKEIAERPDAVLRDVIKHLKSRGVKHVYLSNDIDGTDVTEAPATGTPADQGLSSVWLHALINELGQHFQMVAADICEVAPPLGPTQEASEKTCALAADYVVASLQQMLRR